MSDFDLLLAQDTYVQPRKNFTEDEIRLFLREVDYHCPLCGKELQSGRQKKRAQKLFEIAHIYPNRPTPKQYEELDGLDRLGDNSESYENKIALCKDCHDIQDYNTTKEEYFSLLNKKRACLQKTALNDATISLGLEEDIEVVVRQICEMKDSDFEGLCYDPVLLANKFTTNERLLKTKVSGYVTNYYPYIRTLFQTMELTSRFCMDILNMQIKSCFLKMEKITTDKTLLFDQMVNWIKTKTLAKSMPACEAVVSFFIQHCEVFHEITK